MSVSVNCAFFVSSRRRHTRCLSDWSSDVCSSDLRDLHVLGEFDDFHRRVFAPQPGKIGRAACRERGEISVVAVSLKKKKKRKKQAVRRKSRARARRCARNNRTGPAGSTRRLRRRKWPFFFFQAEDGIRDA